MTKSRVHIWALVAAILLFFFLDPCFMWDAYRSRYIYIFFRLALFGVFVAHIDLIKEGRTFFFIALLAILAYVPFYQGQNYNAYILSLAVCAVPFAKRDFATKTFDYFLTIYTVFIALSGIVWLMHFVGAAPRLGTLPPWNELKEYNYIHYPLLVVPNMSGAEFMRFHGPFDEPGVVGTISAFILTIGKFNFRDKRLQIVFITAFFSFSFFFYLIVLFYYALIFFVQSKHKWSGLLLIVLFVFFYVMTRESLYDVMWSRFEWDASRGTISGDNRMSPIALEVFYSVLGTSEFYTGVAGYTERYEEMIGGSSSILIAIIRYGIVLVSAYLLLFLSYGWKYKKDLASYLFFVFVFLGTMFQRPSMTEPEYLFCFSLMATNFYDVYLEGFMKQKKSPNNQLYAQKE